MSNIGKHGNHRKGPRVKRIEIICAFCNNPFRVLPGFYRLHPVSYCSKKCSGAANRNPDALLELNCSNCGDLFKKRKDHLHINNYCSRECSDIGRKSSYSKWRDPEYIAKYNKEYRRKNRLKLNAKAVERDKANPEAKRQRVKKYCDNNKHKAATSISTRRGIYARGDLTPEKWLSLILFHGSKCLRCGRSEPEITITLDHIKPLSKGGLHTESNVQPLCKSCNSSKATREIDYRF